MMTPEEARAWLFFKSSIYRYLECDTDFSDVDSVRRANIESEKYVKVEAPNLIVISQEVGNV